MKKFLVILILVLAVAGLWYLWKTVDTGTGKVAVFMCDEGKTVTVRFHFPADKYVDVSLSDGRQFVLNHVQSSDGSKYINNDGSLVFWNKGTIAFIQEGENTTYTNCNQKL